MDAVGDVLSQVLVLSTRTSGRAPASLAVFALMLAVAGALAACGDDGRPPVVIGRGTATPSTSAAATGTPVASTPGAATASATAQSDATPPPAATATRLAVHSAIEGYVTIGPTCPVEREDQACDDAPYAVDIIIRSEDTGGETARVRSGADGRFRVAVPAGRYIVAGQSPSPGAPPQAGEETVEVLPGQVAQVFIVYDSGIR